MGPSPTVIASEAKQSSAVPVASAVLDCFVASLLAMTEAGLPLCPTAHGERAPGAVLDCFVASLLAQTG